MTPERRTHYPVSIKLLEVAVIPLEDLDDLVESEDLGAAISDAITWQFGHDWEYELDATQITNRVRAALRANRKADK